MIARRLSFLLVACLAAGSTRAGEDCNGNGIPDDVDVLVTFQAGDIVSGVYDIRALSTADLDGDGDTDLLYADPSSVRWVRNDGAGGFGAAELIRDGLTNVKSATAADLDGDHDLDVISGSGGKVQWCENLGAGGFGPPRVVQQSGLPNHVAAADVDGDLDVDLIVPYSDADQIVWFENTDSFGFFGTPHLISDTTDEPWRVRAVDYDLDGDLDFIGSRFAQDRLLGYKNLTEDCDGNGQLDECEIAAGATDDCNGSLVPDSCELATGAETDCDGDGRIDACDSDCNTNGQSDICEIVSGVGVDCDGNRRLDECDVHCVPPCDADGDACLDPLDCSPNDPAVWAEPSPIAPLLLARQQGTTVLSWPAPTSPGAILVRYDTLQSSSPSDFTTTAFCVETDESDRSAEVIAEPGPGLVFHFLVRVENDCPGSMGVMGSGSDGVPRVGVACP